MACHEYECVCCAEGYKGDAKASLYPEGSWRSHDLHSMFSCCAMDVATLGA